MKSIILKNRHIYYTVILTVLITVCINACTDQTTVTDNKVKPVVVTEMVKYDTDDPAIWVNPADPAKSLIIGTDKEEDGGLYVFDLQGKIDTVRTVRGLKRPNNVDVEYGLILNGEPVDIAVTTERLTNKIRIYSLPGMTAIDDGGIDVFVGQDLRAPMGIALYKRPADGEIFAIVSRKEGPVDGTYLWQYRLADSGNNSVSGVKVREFGIWSGIKEIEAVAVDNELGYVYYSDENVGVRKYYADPYHPEANTELALFANVDFSEDQEGISIYKVNDGTGYILVSDQAAGRFHIFKREGEPGNPHNHQRVKIVNVSTIDSDGSDVSNVPFNDRFPSGMFVAMSSDKTFQIYSWQDIAGEDLVNAPNGEAVKDN